MGYVIVLLLMVIAGLVVYIVAFGPGAKTDAAQRREDGTRVELVHDNVMVQNDLKEFADEVLGRIDRRMGDLKRLIKEADDRIATLETRTKWADERSAAAPSADETQQDDARGAKGAQPADRRSTIVMLARKGLSTDEIAKRVGTGRGEIELILNVENNKRKI